MSARNIESTQAGAKVLACEEAMCEDKNRTISPKVSAECVTRNPTCTTKSHNEIEIIDLYLVGHPHITRTQLEKGEAIPFIHQIELEGPQGELVRVRVLFDNGAMVSAMCTSIFEKVKHRLHEWSRSDRQLRMANGTIIKAVTRWTGTVRIKGVKARSTFEVFDSGGSWGFLFGKPMLQAFAAVHEYTPDTITIADKTQMALLSNQIADQRMLQRENKVNLTLDEKQQRTIAKQKKRMSIRKQHKTIRNPHGSVEAYEAIRQMRGDNQNTREQSGEQTHIDTSVLTEQATDVNVLITQEASENEEEQLLGEIPELEPAMNDPSIYTRQTDPFNPARVKEVLRQIKFGDNLSVEEREELERFITKNADCFALALKEVIPIPGVLLNLNVPENAIFNLRMHQCPLTPEQSKFYNERANDMLAAGIIEQAPPELI
ncbi:hypothetical protein DFJ58DRAFT_737075 [Suillus subalutaceus]|uniref:uncharacterized protein n=1 Tax=Suillus subalutaceus TaxID=48586 RepID=UPI001B8785E5|nr:uncharacterized protein DFJ58DRAFT_737075 [Suillus subalutaceus]KAG1830078.1 hypothetical protein DFJ58DRAFT_737075 [Suillus subalutaceus]